MGNAPKLGAYADSADTADTSAEMAEAEEPETVSEEVVAEAEGKEAALAEGDIVDSGTCGYDATWTLTGTGDNLTLTISGIEMKNFSANPWSSQDEPDIWSNSIWYDRRHEIKTVIVNEGIENIGNYAFFNFDNITSVSLPETLKK